MAIQFFSEDIKFSLSNKSNYKSWIKDTIKSESKKLGSINYIFCSDIFILEINKSYLNHDYYTDIITFNYNEGDFINSDIYISLDTVKTNSDQFKTSFSNELSRVIIHGILHLIGFNDKTESEQTIMTEKEDYYLSRLTLS